MKMKTYWYSHCVQTISDEIEISSLFHLKSVFRSPNTQKI